LILFSMFFFFSGMTRLADIRNIWETDYGVAAALRCVTALLAIVSTLAIWKRIPAIINARELTELIQKNQALEGELGAQRRTLEETIKLNREIERNFNSHTLDQKQRMERFQMLAESIPQLVWSTRADGHADYFNPRWYAYTGQRQENLEGEGWRGVVHPDDLERTAQIWQTALKSGQPYEIQYRLRGEDGGYCWFLGSALPIFDHDGLIVRWFGTCTNVDNLMANQQRAESPSASANFE